MSKAYGWAFVIPIRKIYYNITTTGLSIFVTFVVGTIELLGPLCDQLGLTGRPLGLPGQHRHQHRRPSHRRDIFLIVWIGSRLL